MQSKILWWWLHVFMQKIGLVRHSTQKAKGLYIEKQFSILKYRPTVRIELTRESVCAGDDCDTPHTKNISQPSYTEPIPFIHSLASGYLPTASYQKNEVLIPSHRPTWDCFFNGIQVGTVLTTGIIVLRSEIKYEKTNKAYFRYNSGGVVEPIYL